jgi:hypothetical protein
MRNLVATVLVFAAACTGQPTKNTDEGIEGPGGKGDGNTLPSGTYTNASPKIGEFVTLTLNADHTFTRAADGACPGGGTCAPQTQTGLFLYTISGTTTYLHFYADDGTSLDRAQWTLDGTSLTLTPDGIHGPYTLVQSSSCEAASGVCAPGPGSCPGNQPNAGQYTCSNQGDVCCLPPPHDNSCNVATDCHGLLPQFEKVCSDGHVDAAHWACVNNQCAIAVCD